MLEDDMHNWAGSCRGSCSDPKQFRALKVNLKGVTVTFNSIFNPDD